MGGNPWILNTHGLAEFFYSAASSPGIPSPQLWQTARSLGGDRCLAEAVPSEAKSALVCAGDALLLRVRHHIGDGMRMSEQIDKQSGEPVGAVDLTWAYATAIGAIRARNVALKVAIQQEAHISAY